jgi:hypothetical protein
MGKVNKKQRGEVIREPPKDRELGGKTAVSWFWEFCESKRVLGG